MENMMDHVAAELGLDPLVLRQRNLIPDGSTRRLNKQVMLLRSRMAGTGELARTPVKGLTLHVP